MAIVKLKKFKKQNNSYPVTITFACAYVTVIFRFTPNLSIDGEYQNGKGREPQKHSPKYKIGKYIINLKRFYKI